MTKRPPPLYRESRMRFDYFANIFFIKVFDYNINITARHMFKIQKLYKVGPTLVKKKIKFSTENQILLIYMEIQDGAVAKSNMTKGLFIYGEIFAHFLIY